MKNTGTAAPLSVLTIRLIKGLVNNVRQIYEHVFGSDALYRLAHDA